MQGKLDSLKFITSQTPRYSKAALNAVHSEINIPVTCYDIFYRKSTTGFQQN